MEGTKRLRATKSILSLTFSLVSPLNKQDDWPEPFSRKKLSQTRPVPVSSIECFDL